LEHVPAGRSEKSAYWKFRYRRLNKLTTGFELQRLGILMEPEPGNPHEVEGVLNPAATRGPDGQLYLFPRLVARGN
jgi:hypothetical protein